MKRFWDTAEMLAVGNAFEIRLDGRIARLPDGAPLRLPTRALADAVADEWQRAGDAKGGSLQWSDLPLTRLAAAAQDWVAADREAVVLAMARYAESDLLCYRADAPEALVRRQSAAWQPLLDWAESAYGARLKVTTGLAHVAQDPEALAALAGAVAAETTPALAALGAVVPALGSLVLGLAMTTGRLDAAGAWALATLDETFQVELWGRDDTAEQRRAAMGEEVAVAGRFMELAR